MKYTRAKAVTCALTASVVLFGSAAQINATSASFDLPAAGVGLVLEESSSLSSVQEETVQSEKAEETAAEAQSAPEVTHEDIESGLTGVGESSIDMEVADHVEEQQMAAAIDNGVGVANVLDAPAVENAQAPVETEPVAPVDLMMVQAQAMAVTENELKAGAGQSAGEADSSSEQQNQEEPEEPSDDTHKESPADSGNLNGAAPESTADDSGEAGKEQGAGQPAEDTDQSGSEQSDEDSDQPETESSAEHSGESNGEQSAEDIGETEKPGQTGAEQPAEPSTENSGEPETEPSTENPGELETESSTENPGVPGTESSTESGAQAGQPAAGTGEAQTQQPAETEAAAEAGADSAAAEQAPVADAQSSATVVGKTTGHEVVDFAVQFVGNPYVYGGTSLTNGADCSGFVMSVYENFGIDLPHSSRADRNVGTDVGSLENAQPGDLVCYSGHVGIYIGDNQIVHASTPSTGIKISDADYRTPVAVRRVLN